MIKLVLAISKLMDECYEADPIFYIAAYYNNDKVINDGLLFSKAVEKFLDYDSEDLRNYILELKLLPDLQSQEERVMDNISSELWHDYIETQINKYQREIGG